MKKLLLVQVSIFIFSSLKRRYKLTFHTFEKNVKTKKLKVLSRNTFGLNKRAVQTLNCVLQGHLCMKIDLLFTNGHYLDSGPLSFTIDLLYPQARITLYYTPLHRPSDGTMGYGVEATGRPFKVTVPWWGQSEMIQLSLLYEQNSSNSQHRLLAMYSLSLEIKFR